MDSTDFSKNNAPTDYSSPQAEIAWDIGTWRWDIETDSVTGNSTLNALFGLPTESQPLEKYLAAIHPDDIPRVKESLHRAIADNGSNRYREEYRLAVGNRERWIRSQGVVKRDANGIAKELSGIALDISLEKMLEIERRSLLEKADAQRRIFDTTLSSITDFAYIFDRRGRFAYVNKALLDLWGLSLDQAVGKNFFDLNYPDDLASRLQRQIQQVIDSGQIVRDETPYTSPTGAGGFYEYIFAPVFSPDGSIEAVAGSTRDVSIHKQTENALRSRTAQFETLLSAAPLGVYLIDADFRIREINPQALPVFAGIADVIGRDFDEVMHLLWPPHFADDIVKLFRRTLETGEPHIESERSENRRNIQRKEFYEWQINRIVLPDGRYGVVCYFREISAQVNARIALEVANRQKNEFLAMLAHELRNPLAPIRNSSELLARMLPTDAPSQPVVDIIKRQVGHLTRLVDDLLDVSRISQGRIDLQLQRLEISSVIAQAVETVAPLVREKRHDLVISKCYSPLYVNVDAARLIQCIANILTNAAKYTDPGGQIQLQSRSHDGQAVISISDSGVGIADELMPRLFDLFVQDDRTLDRAQGGLGIGLAIVKRLIEMHDGQVTAASRGVGQGSTFEIRLPLVEQAEVVPTKLPNGDVTARRILVVDDNVDAANTLTMVLKLDGHVAEAVYSGVDALAQLDTFHPHIVLLDIGLPELDGYEVARRILAGWQQSIHLIALTGYGQAADRQRALNAGFKAHLVKPVDISQLKELIGEFNEPLTP